VTTESTDLVGDGLAPGEARRFIRSTWRKYRLDEVCFDDAILIVSELVTNAVNHTKSGQGGTVALTVLVGEDCLLLVVGDEGALSNPRRPDRSDLMHVSSETGRGLALVNELSSTWGWYPLDHAINGRVVWAQIPAKVGSRTPAYQPV
jgi:anti-sigma regulatory factor (Ser/Thr protein kinase)